MNAASIANQFDVSGFTQGASTAQLAPNSFLGPDAEERTASSRLQCEHASPTATSRKTWIQPPDIPFGCNRRERDLPGPSLFLVSVGEDTAMDRVAVRGKQAAAAPSNLPHHLTSFVGREAELRSLKRLLSTSRLVTLTGTGGAGKSRLASELAAANSSLWPDGVWWIELAATDDVSGAVVATLELPGRGPAQDVVASWLAARKALLILDNCEHLVAECAAFCQRVLQRCPELNIIATSREALGVPGEARWPVSSLRDPDAVLLFEGARAAGLAGLQDRHRATWTP